MIILDYPDIFESEANSERVKANSAKERARRAEATSNNNCNNSIPQPTAVSNLGKQVMKDLDIELVQAWEKGKGFRDLKVKYSAEGKTFRPERAPVALKAVAKILSKKINACASAENDGEFMTALNANYWD